MSQVNRLQRSEVAILGKGFESVLRRILRLLLGKISLVKLHEIIDFIYVEELEDKLRRDRPDSKVTLSKLAINTGLDTRVIKRIRSSPSYKKSLVEEKDFFRNFTPAASILHLWSTDPRFIDQNTGSPKALSLTGKSNSIEKLAGTLKLPRGVTINSVIEQLESSELIDYDRDKDLVEMRTDRYLPLPDKDQEGALEIGFVAVSRLIDTVVRNLKPGLPKADRLFQRVYWINRLPPHQLKGLRKRLTRLLNEVEKDGYMTLNEFDRGVDMPGQISAGFGLFLFEDEINGS